MPVLTEKQLKTRREVTSGLREWVGWVFSVVVVDGGREEGEGASKLRVEGVAGCLGRLTRVQVVVIVCLKVVVVQSRFGNASNETRQRSHQSLN